MGNKKSIGYVTTNEMTKKPGLVRSLSCGSKRSRKIKTTTRIPVNEYEALQHMKGDELSTLVRLTRTDGSFVSVTAMSTADLNEINKLMSQMRTEEMSLDRDEMDRIVKMGISLNAMDEDVEAFIKPLPDKQIVVIYAFDYTNLNRAVHYIKVRIQRLQMTPDARRKRNLKKIASVEADVTRNPENKYYKGEKGMTTTLTAMSRYPTYLAENSNNYAQTVLKNNPVIGQELLQQQHELVKLEDKIEYKALTQLIGRDFISAFRAIKDNPTNKSSSDRKYVLDLLDSLKREDVVFSPDEMNTLRNELDVKTDRVNAFIKALDNVDKIAIFTFDYTSMKRAKHLLSVKCGRVKVTSGRTVKRNEDGDSGEQFKRYSSKSSTLVTMNDIQISVYKADITQLTVDVIVNAANEHLAHGGGVALAISRAAGHDLDIEGDEYIKNHGHLKVTDVVPTSSGNLPCKKVLHAVGPCWTDYQDKNLCQQHLAQTVYNCFLLAHKLQVTSLAMSCIGSALFRVPKEICATMYLAALQRFDYEYGSITTLRHIHFVDISDEMVAMIQDTFIEKWNTTVKPPKDQRSKTYIYGSEWDWDERAPCSPLEMKEKGSQNHSFPRRVRRDETRDSWYDVEPFNKKYFPQQSHTRQFDDASPREKGTTQYGFNYPDCHTSTRIPPGGLLNNSSANNKPLREIDFTYGPIRSWSGQTRELEDRNETTSSHLSRNYYDDRCVTTTTEMCRHPTYLAENSNNSAQTVHTNNPVNGQELLQQQNDLLKMEDKLEYEALTQIIGRDFISAFRAIKDNPTNKSSFERKYVLGLLDSLKREDIVFSPDEMNTLRNELDVKTEGVNAFIKAVDVDKIAICAFDYTSMNMAIHLLNVKCGRVKITSGRTVKCNEGRTVKRNEDGDAGKEFKRYSSKSSTLVTMNDIQVSVYKADITQLTVDAIVNAANEHLAHGGGVALAIAKAAGHVLEIEGDEYIKTHGSLKVTDVVPTSSGNLPFKKVLHAVGPRWKDYQDKNLCQQHLAHTVFNCFLLADKLHLTSLAMSSISSALFRVPKEICATMYLAAIQRFDYEYGSITTLRHIHFVDISDDMVATIQDRFTEKWNTTVKPPKDQRSRTDIYGSEWDWDERAPCSSLEMKEKGSRNHSFPRRVRRDEKCDSFYDVEPFNKKYFLQQSDTRQFDDASPKEKGTTQYGFNYPDRHNSTKMLPGGLSNNSSANNKLLRKNDFTHGPIRSRSGQTRERNETTSSYVSRNFEEFGRKEFLDETSSTQRNLQLNYGLLERGTVLNECRNLEEERWKKFLEKTTTNSFLLPFISDSWQISSEFSSNGGQMQEENSDVVLYVPENAIESSSSVTIHTAVSTNLEMAHERFGLDGEEMIVSPVVEFTVEPNIPFNKSVWVILPHFLTQPYSPEHISVYRFQNKMLERLQFYPNDERTSVSEGNQRDGFSVLKNGKICIFFSHFTGFFCTQCRRQLEPDQLHLRAYGQYEQRDKREVKLLLFVWDERLQIKDFEKDFLIGREKTYEVQKSGLLDAAPKDSKVCLGIEFLMQDNIRKSWNFTEMDGHQLFPSRTTRNLENIFGHSHLQKRTRSNRGEEFPHCCYSRKPLRIEWALEERPGCMPSKWFQCAIRVGYSTTFDPEPLHFLEKVRIETLHVNDLKLKEAKNSSSQTDLCETHESRAARPSSIPSFNEGFQPSSLQPTMPVPNYTINNIHVNTLKGQVIAANENVQHSISATVLQDNMSTVSSAEPVMEIESPHIQPDSENGN